LSDASASLGGAVQFKQPSSGGLPTKVLSMWHHRWAGPNLRNYPSDVVANINLYVLGLAQGCPSGGGCMEYIPVNGQSVSDHAADIRAIRARGVHVLMGFGGAGGTIAITNAAQVTQAFNSIVGFVDTYGISGIDVDMEPSGSSWNEQSLNSLASQLKTKYGSGFIVGLTPGLYDVYTDKWLSAARLMGNNYDYMAPMLYDFPEAGDSRLTAVSVNKADIMVAGGVPQNKMIMGYMARPDPSYLNSTPTSMIMLDAYRAVEAKYPNVRGFFIWEDAIMASRNWDFVRDSVSAGQP
jgi:chitinase